MPTIRPCLNGIAFRMGSGQGLSTLSVWFLKLGIALERSRPGKPQDNGSHERMHRVLKQEAARRPRRNVTGTTARAEHFLPDRQRAAAAPRAAAADAGEALHQFGTALFRGCT